MRINEITESFNSRVPHKIVDADKDGMTIEAEIGGRKIIFNAVAYGDAGERQVDIDFYEKHGNTEFYAPTGSGNEMQVFSFIFDAIKEVINKYDPDVITFESRKSEGNRTKLYKRMVSRFPDYKIAEIDDGYGMDIFRIVKKDK